MAYPWLQKGFHIQFILHEKKTFLFLYILIILKTDTPSFKTNECNCWYKILNYNRLLVMLLLCWATMLQSNDELLCGHRGVFSLSATQAMKMTQPIRHEDWKPVSLTINIIIKIICKTYILILIWPVTDDWTLNIYCFQTKNS